MSRIIPYPFLSAGLLVLWLMLTQSLSPGQIVLGSAIALIGGWAYGALQQPRTRFRKLSAIFRLSSQVLYDIVRSNIAVARIILGLQGRQWTSGLVEITLELRNPYGLAALACIITSTPGTLWVDFDETTGTLTIHVLDLVDRATWVAIIKERYEKPLMEIFA